MKGVTAIEGRKMRFKAFDEWVESNRKDYSESDIESVYSVESGLSLPKVKEYLKVLKVAKKYRSNGISGYKLVTPEEYTPMLEAYQEKQRLADLERDKERNPWKYEESEEEEEEDLPDFPMS